MASLNAAVDSDTTEIGSEQNEVVRQDQECRDKVLLDKRNEDRQLGKSLGESLLYLYENKLWTDVSFRCMDHKADERILAHRVILAARSPVFHKMLYVYDKISGDKEDQELPTVEAEIFHLIVKYMYSDTTDLTEGVAAKVMEVAHMYQIQGLVQYCAKYLMTIVAIENACEILDLTLFYDTQELRESVCDFIDDNAGSVMESDTFKDISETCLTYILKGDTFYADETEIVEAADSWALQRLNEPSKGNSGPEKRKLLGEGFFYLRIPSMEMEEFLDCTQYKNFYAADEIYEIMEEILRKGMYGQPDVSCHSSVKRVPREQTLTFDKITSSFTDKCSSVNCSMVLHAFRDFEIVRICLYENYTLSYGDRPLQETKCIFFRGRITVDCNVEAEFAWNPWKTNAITLKFPIKLPARAWPYGIGLSLTLESDPSITVEVDKLSDKSQRFVVGYQDGVIQLDYSDQSAHVNIIKSVDIRTFSNRDTSNELTDIQKRSLLRQRVARCEDM